MASFERVFVTARLPLLVLLLPQLHLLSPVYATKPAPAKYFHHQTVDHLNPHGRYAGREWTQRYYTWDRWFQGAGSPIFVIMGGEGSIPPSVGLHYPYITDYLAKAFGAYVLQPEHRFYGESQPLGCCERNGNCESSRGSACRDDTEDGTLTPDTDAVDPADRHDPRLKLLTPQQAVMDAVVLLDRIREELDCSQDRRSRRYCPVITVGGSYPGFLAAFSRIMVPHIVDMAYAASAPMKFYSQHVNAAAYYDHISSVAGKANTDCPDGVSDALVEIQKLILGGSFQTESVGICPGSVPSYIDSNATLADELFMVVAYTFANDNMAYYPPDDNSRLFRACRIFSDPSLDACGKVKEFLLGRIKTVSDGSCWKMTDQLPSGPRGTISSGDWSGVGTGGDGESWDFQTCSILVEAIGFSESSMFPKRDWSLDWLTGHCRSRFNVTPDPHQLVDEWKFDRLLENNVTRILFTNGANDGWSVGGITEPLSMDLPVINFPNGAHHSDLSGRGPSNEDTPDVMDGFVAIQDIFAGWLEQLKGDRYPEKVASLT